MAMEQFRSNNVMNKWQVNKLNASVNARTNELSIAKSYKTKPFTLHIKQAMSVITKSCHCSAISCTNHMHCLNKQVIFEKVQSPEGLLS